MSKSPARAARARGLSLRTNLHLTMGRARLGHTQFTSLTYSWVLASKVWMGPLQPLGPLDSPG